jgi:antitoxin Phd
MRKWPVQDAKAHFSEMLKASLNEGPQFVTRRGVETAVLIAVEEWKKLNAKPGRTLKELLLADEPRFDFEVPRRKVKFGRGVDFSDD